MTRVKSVLRRAARLSRLVPAVVAGGALAAALVVPAVSQEAVEPGLALVAASNGGTGTLGENDWPWLLPRQ